MPDSIWDWPHTVTRAIEKRMQIESFMELPKDKRPPESIWDDPDKIDDWFDRVFDRGEKQTELVINIPEHEIE